MKKPFVVGIAGGTASGKGTFAKMLAEKFPAQATIVSMDMYYKDQSHLPLEERSASNMDCPEAFDMELFSSHVKDLIAGRSIEQPIYDFAAHTRKSQKLKVSARSGAGASQKLVIVEGLLTLRDERRQKLFDLKIFLEAEADLRLARRLLRDLKEKRYETPEASIKQYLTSARPNHKIFVEPQKKIADLIVNWNTIKDKEVEKVANIINSKCKTYLIFNFYHGAKSQKA